MIEMLSIKHEIREVQSEELRTAVPISHLFTDRSIYRSKYFGHSLQFHVIYKNISQLLH